MGINIQEFVRLRPFVYHISARENVSFLRASGTLWTTLNLLEAAGRPELANDRRVDYVALQLPLGLVVLKDQKPLIEANTALPDDWCFADFVRYLNSMTYFWPGSAAGPIGRGRRLLQHYELDGPLVLRVPTSDLLQANASLTPLFSPFNSGAPRYHSGQKARRGPDTFSPHNQFPRRTGEVVELAFAGNITLPKTTTYRTADGWSNFFAGE
jgi:hypothetical protein